MSVCLFASILLPNYWMDPTKLGMDHPLDAGNVIHILFGGYPHQREYNFGKNSKFWKLSLIALEQINLIIQIT